MKRGNGWAMGLGLLAAGTIGGGAFAVASVAGGAAPVSVAPVGRLGRLARSRAGLPVPASVNPQGMESGQLTAERLSGTFMNPDRTGMGAGSGTTGTMLGTTSVSSGGGSRATTMAGAGSQTASGHAMNLVSAARGLTGSSGGMMGH